MIVVFTDFRGLQRTESFDCALIDDNWIRLRREGANEIDIAFYRTPRFGDDTQTHSWHSHDEGYEIPYKSLYICKS